MWLWYPLRPAAPRVGPAPGKNNVPRGAQIGILLLKAEKGSGNLFISGKVHVGEIQEAIFEDWEIGYSGFFFTQKKGGSLATKYKQDYIWISY